jgi:hypothetical protein
MAFGFAMFCVCAIAVSMTVTGCLDVLSGWWQ